jgi:hypothetical protein
VVGKFRAAIEVRKILHCQVTFLGNVCTKLARVQPREAFSLVFPTTDKSPRRNSTEDSSGRIVERFPPIYFDCSLQVRLCVVPHMLH